MSAPTGGGHAEPRCSCGRAFRTIAPDGGICEAGHFIKRDARGLLPSAAAPPGDRSAPPAADHRRTAGRVRLSDVEPESVRWLWPGRIPLGKITLVEGKPDLGKSTLLLDLAARVTTGGTWPDGGRGDLLGPAGVVILSAEDGLADTIRPRLDAAGADCARIVARQTVTRITTTAAGDEREDVRLPTLGDLEDLEADITDTGAVLLIVDPLMAYLPSGVDSYRDQDVRRVLAPLAALAERTGAAIVLLRHQNKGNDPDPLHRGGGSIGVIAAVRSGLMVARDPDDPEDRRRILARIKSNLSRPALALAYHLDVAANGAPFIVWEGVTQHTAAQLLHLPADGDERSAATDARAFLLDYLADGPQSADRVLRAATEAGVAERTLRRAKAAIGVESVKEPKGLTSGWRWELPKAANTANPQELAALALFDDRGILRAASRVDGATAARCPGGCGRPGDAGHPTGRCWFCRDAALVGGAR